MAYSAPSTRSTSDLITAAIWNADVVANPIAIYAGAMSVTSQAVGDILYASSTTQLGRIAAVATGQVLTSAGTGTVPAWSSNVDLGGTLGVAGAVTFNDAGADVDFRVESSSQSHMLFVDGGTDQVGVEISSFTSTGGAGTKLEVGGSIVVKKDQGHLYVYSNDYIIGKIGNSGSGANLDTGYFSLSRGDGTEIIKLNAGDGADCEINKDNDTCTYIGKSFLSSSGTNMTGDRAHFGHVDNETGTDYAIMQTADGNTNMNCKTGQRNWFLINAGAVGNWDATGLRVGDSTAASYKLDVNGSLNKTSGTFSIDHPLPSMRDTHRLVHSFVEGPRADLIYRGTATLSAGTVDIDMDEAAGMTPGTWVLLCRDEQCYTSNETGWHHVRGTVVGSTLTIDCEEECDDVISWMVVACRKDQHMYDTDTLWTDDDGYPILEPLKPPSSASTSPSASASPSE